MRYPRHTHHPRHVSLLRRFYLFILWPLLIILLVIAASGQGASSEHNAVSFPMLVAAALATLMRITIAYILAVVFAIPLALLAAWNKALEALLLPIYDVFESIPILAIFPVVLLLFVRFDFLNGAAIFILFLNMLWNIVFAVVGGLELIPKDIKYAARVFGLSGMSYIRQLVVPAIFPQLITGSILAVADGWNIIIVAEALHTYIPNGTPAQDLFGIGSFLVAAAANAQNGVFLTSVLVMVVMIALINFFVWQKLLHYSQRFRFE